MNEHGEIENLSTDHYTSPVHLMRIAPQFKKFCINYKVQPVIIHLCRKIRMDFLSKSQEKHSEQFKILNLRRWSTLWIGAHHLLPIALMIQTTHIQHMILTTSSQKFCKLSKMLMSLKLKEKNLIQLLTFLGRVMPGLLLK